MSSKIFKSSYMSDSSRLEIEASIASTSFHITHYTVVGEKSFMFDNTTAPALCLAILEAAGHVRDACSDNDADVAMEWLHSAIARQAKQSAEAKEQAELEAEALELYNTWREVNAYEALSSFSDGAPIGAMAEWLAVARRAREMRKP